MDDLGSKLLHGINMYVNSLVCVRLKGVESRCFRINSGVKQGLIMSNVYLDAVMKSENGDRENGSKISVGGEWKEPGLLYAEDLVLCGKLEHDLKVMA